MVGIRACELWLFGGNSNNGSNCGLAYANSNNAWSNSNANISARLTIRKRNKNYKGVCTASWDSTRMPRTSAACAYVKHVRSEQDSPCAMYGQPSRPWCQ